MKHPSSFTFRSAARRKRRALIVSFDIARPSDPVLSLAVGSLLAYARSLPAYGRTFDLTSHSVLVDGVRPLDAEAIAVDVSASTDVRRLDLIAMAAYAWSEPVIGPLMRALRQRGFAGVFTVGGYQITTKVDLERLYPDARYLIEGPGERALLRAILERPADRVLTEELDLSELVSPYLGGTIAVPFGTPMVRMETQRGCRWRCRFCSYRGHGEGPVLQLPLDRVAAELRLFADRRVSKVNVLDPEFNWSRKCVGVLRAMIDAGLTARITVQARPENLVKAPWAGEFLSHCRELDIHLEFGLQTANPRESAAIDRRNDLDAVARAFDTAGSHGISFEASLIYGLPEQTVETFAESIAFARRHGVPVLRCHPLMLHRGTPLSIGRDRWSLDEEILDGFGIPYVTSSSTFSRADWEVMCAMADAASAPLDPGVRVSPGSTNLKVLS